MGKLFHAKARRRKGIRIKYPWLSLFPSVNSFFIFFTFSLWFCPFASAADLVVELDGGEGVTAVGAFNRWDEDGNARKPLDTKAAIDSPAVDAAAVHQGGGRWVFKNLPAGRYDLVVMGPNFRRIEGWHYPPVLEFDPFFAPDAPVADDARGFIIDDIRKSRHYENKVEPLALGGDEQAVRVLVMLVRDLTTSYTEGTGTIRFEIWQYTWKYGAWVKEKRTRVLHRILLPVSELKRWNWLWDGRLGGVEVKGENKEIRYNTSPKRVLPKLKGWRSS